MKKRKKIISANINHCFSEKDKKWRENLIEKISKVLIENNIDFAENEDKISNYWNDIDAFQKSLDIRKESKIFRFAMYPSAIDPCLSPLG